MITLKKTPDLGASESDQGKKPACIAQAQIAGINKALISVVLVISMSVEWLAICTLHYIGACQLPSGMVKD